MLVSSIAQFDAVNRKHDASFAMLQAMNCMHNAVKYTNSFAGEHSLDLLHEMDNRLSLDLVSNALLYKIACLEEKMLTKMKANEFNSAKKSLDYVA